MGLGLGAIAGGIGMVGSALGGYFGYKGQKKQIASQEAINQRNLQMQREFAQKGVQWKVADAKEAGISPLAALGAQTHSFAPLSVGSSSGMQDMALGNAISDMGQNMSRALMATATHEERKRQILQTKNLQLKNAKLEQDIAMGQQANSFARTSTPGNPPMQNVENILSPRTMTTEKKRNIQAGAISDVGFVNTGTGLAPVPSVDVKERIEDQLIPETAWALRNYFGPIFSDKAKPTKQQIKSEFPNAKDVYWNGYEWRPEYGNKKPNPYLNKKPYNKGRFK